MDKKFYTAVFFFLFLSVLFLSFCSTSAAWIEGPFVNNVTPNSVVIWWNSSPHVAGKVFIKDFKELKDSSFPFELKITGLKPDTTYSYCVVFDNGKRYPPKGYYQFHTAFKGEKRFSFAVLADSRAPFFSLSPVNEEILKKLLSEIKKKKVEFICFLGDLVYGDTKSAEKLRDKFRTWKNIASFVMHEIPIYTAMGNHEIVFHEADGYILDGEKKGKDIIYSEKIFADEFVNPENSPFPESPFAPPYKETVYSFDWGNSHFIFINTDYWIVFPKRSFWGKQKKIIKLYKNGNLPGIIMENQLKWIEKDLKRAKACGAKHIFVFGHQPIFPITHDEEDAIEYNPNATKEAKEYVKKRRKQLWELFDKYGVKAAFFGHEHNYSRTLINNTWQIITGGAGAPLRGRNNKVHYPWLNGLKKFKKCYHYCIVTVDKDKVELSVFGIINGRFQLIDHAYL